MTCYDPRLVTQLLDEICDHRAGVAISEAFNRLRPGHLTTDPVPCARCFGPAETAPVYTCRVCGEPIDAKDILWAPGAAPDDVKPPGAVVTVGHAHCVGRPA